MTSSRRAALGQHLKSVCDRFHFAWEKTPRVADFLDDVKDSDRAPLLVELISIDLEHRWKRGERRGIESLLDDWPELKADTSARYELVWSECQLRVWNGERPSAAD